jgi:hypothetical protein
MLLKFLPHTLKCAIQEIELSFLHTSFSSSINHGKLISRMLFYERGKVTERW